MPTPSEFKAPFYPECFYHIVCKSVDGILLFKEHADYDVYTKRFQQFTYSLFDVWSYCLLNNHTHHIIRVKSLAEITAAIEKQENKTEAMRSFLADPDNEELVDAMVERQMNSFLVSFANYVNNRYNRKGGLFQKPFRRTQITDDSHLQQAIIYVHANAQKHGLVKDFKEYLYSSYPAIINNGVVYKNVLDFFGGMEAFKNIHQSQVEYYYTNNWPSSKLE